MSRCAWPYYQLQYTSCVRSEVPSKANAFPQNWAVKREASFLMRSHYTAQDLIMNVLVGAFITRRLHCYLVTSLLFSRLLSPQRGMFRAGRTSVVTQAMAVAPAYGSVTGAPVPTGCCA